MDPDVAQLVREQRLLEAAGLASARGDFHEASRIYEQACEWSKAAAEALHAGDGPRALRLSVFGGDDDIAARALAVVGRDATASTSAAAQLTRAGRHAWAARVFEERDRPGDAARSWEKAGETRRAGAAFVRAGEAAEAARVLQTTLAQEPTRWDLAVDLGQLLGRLGRWEAAARAVQKVPPAARERADAVFVLVDAFDALGWSHAAAESRVEAGVGGTERPDAAAIAGASIAVPRGSLFGRYAVVREVASSPRARVLECTDPVLGERVAVKVFTAIDGPAGGPAAIARFAADVLALRGSRHPAVVPVLEYLPQGPATVQAWMPGGDLECLLGRFGALAPARAVEVACAVLSGLAMGHEMGVLHRAVKPTNVLFDPVGGARLGDFGSAQLADVAATMTTALSRTLGYVAPELRQGRAPTERSDLYPVGVMLHEMLTGIAPDPHLPLRPPPSHVHPALDARHDDAVSRLAAPDPADRPAGAREAIAALLDLAWTGPGAVLPGAGAIVETPWRDEAGRIAEASNGAPFDAWIARGIERVSSTPAALARARAFARAGTRRSRPCGRSTRPRRRSARAAGPGPRSRPRRRRAPEPPARPRRAPRGRRGPWVGREGVRQGAQGWTLAFGGEPRPGAAVEEDLAALATL